MPSILVLNDIRQSVPGSGTVRLGMDFGNLNEIKGGDLIASCTVSISPTTSPALTRTGSVTVTDGYLVTAVFTGGTAGSYSITFTPTLVSGQVLPPRVGTLVLE